MEGLQVESDGGGVILLQAADLGGHARFSTYNNTGVPDNTHRCPHVETLENNERIEPTVLFNSWNHTLWVENLLAFTKTVWMYK